MMTLYTLALGVSYIVAFIVVGGPRATIKNVFIAMFVATMLPTLLLISEGWRVLGITTHNQEYSVYWNERGGVTTVSSLNICFTESCAPLDADVYAIFLVTPAGSVARPPVSLFITVRVMDPLRALAGEDLRTITPEAHIKQIIVRESVAVLTAANHDLSEEEVKQLLRHPLFVNGLVLN